MAHFRATAKVLFALIWLMLGLAAAIPVVLVNGRSGKHRLIQLFYRGVLWIWGVRLTVKGEFIPQGPVLIISNHTSYLDIPILGSLTPMVFTPKSEIAHWPGIGALCRFCDVVFIERKASRAGAYREILRKQLEESAKLCLFAEGTTGEGRELLPFKSSFFSIAEEPVAGQAVPVQPVVIAYRQVNFRPITSENRLQVAWVGDADFFPHFWHALGFRRLEVTVYCLPPRYFSEVGDRKLLASAMRETMDAALKAMVSL